VEIPGFFMPLLIMDRFGRRYSLCGLMLLSGLCCIGTIFAGGDQHVLQLVLFLIGKLTITASFQVLYFFASEIFPTNLRNSLLSFCSMMGRFGSMIAPQTPLLVSSSNSLSSIPTYTFISCFRPSIMQMLLPFCSPAPPYLAGC